MSDTNAEASVLDQIDGILNPIDEAQQENEPESHAESQDLATDDQEVIEDADEEAPTWGKTLGIDEDKIVFDEEGNFKAVKVKDGEVGLNDLINGYQFNKANTERSQALAEERKQFDIVKNQASEEYVKKLTDTQKLTEYLHKKLTSDFDGIDWNALRTQNPAEYAALKYDFDNRSNELQQIYAVIQQERDQEQGKFAQQRQEFYAREAQKIITDNPEWADTAKFKAGIDSLANLAGEYGISAEEFHNSVDSRVVKMMQDLQKFKAGKSVVEKKLSKPLPTFQKATGKAPAKPTKLEQLTKAAKAATGANQRNAQVAAVNHLLFGD